MMARTQITMDPELQARARSKAAALGISLAEYVRRLVARDVEEATPEADVESVFDLGGSGGSDVARDKDDLLGRSLAESRDG